MLVLGPALVRKVTKWIKIFIKCFWLNLENKFTFQSKIKQKFFNLKFVTDKLIKANVKVDQVNRDIFTENGNFLVTEDHVNLSKDYGRCISTVCMPELN